MTFERQSPETIIALQAARIAALEKQLREAVDLARITELEIRAILAGCGDTDEQMRASVPLMNLRGHLEGVKGISGGNEAAAGGSGSRLVGEDEQPPRSSTPTTPAETSALPTAAEIEADYIERGHKPLRKLALVRRPSTAECFRAATDDGREPKGAA